MKNKRAEAGGAPDIKRRRARIALAAGALLLAAVAAFALIFREDGETRTNRLYFKGIDAIDAEEGYVRVESRMLLTIIKGDAQRTVRVRSNIGREGAAGNRRWSARVRRDDGGESTERNLYFEAGTMYQDYGGKKIAWTVDASTDSDVMDLLGAPELPFTREIATKAESAKNSGGGVSVTMTLDGAAVAERLTDILALFGRESAWEDGGLTFRNVYLTAELARGGALAGRTLSFAASGADGTQFVCDLSIKAALGEDGAVSQPPDIGDYEKAVASVR
ncbi:MAG: hypothetical protein LBC28_00200 [Oscillospiraceae bacterium]|jgi:hypothetical protein|nr:hypothetical protein [Oscillospiraceae bacterium]